MDIDERSPRMSAGAVIVVVAVALGLGALLNAGDLRDTAERQEYGWQRSVAVALADPLHDLSDALWLNRPRRMLDLALGRDGIDSSPSGRPPTGEGTVAAPTTPSPSPDAPTPAATTTAPGTDASERHTRSPSPSPSPEPLRRTVTAAEPMAMYIGGDSMVGEFGPALEDVMEDTGAVEAEFQYEFESGLTRPDFVDWPARLRRISQASDPEVMVLFFGGNDAQPLKLDGTVHEPEDEPWQAEYRRRVADLMDQLGADGHDVYWIGMPIARDDRFRARMRILNGIYASEADDREMVTFVPSWDLFAGPDGTFSEYLPNRDGDIVDMRLNDGIHLTTAGAYRLARHVAAVIADAWSLPPPDPD